MTRRHHGFIVLTLVIILLLVASLAVLASHELVISVYKGLQ